MPLVEHTLKAAERSECFSVVYLSSDDEEILAIGERYPSVVAAPRSERLSGDKVTALELVLDILSDASIRESYDVVSLLLPTCPFRNANHIIDGFSKLSDQVDGVVSLTEYEFPPQLSVQLVDGLISPVFNPCPLMTGDTRSQDQEAILRPNGAFYIQRMSSFLENRNFWKGKVAGYLMSRSESVDIDTESDLQYAQFLWDQKNGS